MNLGMSLGMSMCFRQETPCCDSIFPQVEEWLASSDHQRALEWVASRKNMDRYRSRVDFLACEIFPELQPSCWRFYEGKGPKLGELLGERVVARLQEVLLESLGHAYATFKEVRRVSWRVFRSEALAASGVAP